MSNTIPIFRKEFRRYFASPIGTALLIGSGFLCGLAIYAPNPAALIGPVFMLSGFSPGQELLQHSRVMLLAGVVRVLAVFLIPMIAMRLFIEEKRARTIEMLFTSPVRDSEIILAKWLGAFAMYLLILGLPILELAVSLRWRGEDWYPVLAMFGGLTLQGAGLLAIGECLSTLTRHEIVAAFWTLLVCQAAMRYYSGGVLQGWDIALCATFTAIGWLLTWRSIQALRGTL